MAIRKLNDAARLANPVPTSYTSRLNLRAEGKGPWFPARFGGECDSCGDMFEENMEIRADGHGGWEGRECCNYDEE